MFSLTCYSHSGNTRVKHSDLRPSHTIITIVGTMYMLRCINILGGETVLFERPRQFLPQNWPNWEQIMHLEILNRNHCCRYRNDHRSQTSLARSFTSFFKTVGNDGSCVCQVDRWDHRPAGYGNSAKQRFLESLLDQVEMMLQWSLHQSPVMIQTGTDHSLLKICFHTWTSLRKESQKLFFFKPYFSECLSSIGLEAPDTSRANFARSFCSAEG